jgi:two-component system, NarL family, nitrate/nitrite sensor histidine kinase NarX
LYLLVIAFSDGATNFYMMRAVYLAMAGYLIAFFGQQRAKFEGRVRELETKAERHTIARSLHDGYVQALAGVNLRLETCRELLLRERPADAHAQLTELQMGVRREYDEVRTYIRSLVELDRTMAAGDFSAALETRFTLQAAFTVHGLLVEQILQIVLEGIRNTWRHGRAQSAKIDVREIGETIRIAIDDDGVGFPDSQSPPWAIASRVAEFGGHLKVSGRNHTGTHLEIEMPTT